MTYPQSVIWGHLGTRSAAQFALMNPTSFTGQEVYVDTGFALTSYYSDGLNWLLTATLPNPVGLGFDIFGPTSGPSASAMLPAVNLVGCSAVNFADVTINGEKWLAVTSLAGGVHTYNLLFASNKFSGDQLTIEYKTIPGTELYAMTPLMNRGVAAENALPTSVDFGAPYVLGVASQIYVTGQQDPWFNLGRMAYTWGARTGVVGNTAPGTATVGYTASTVALTVGQTTIPIVAGNLSAAATVLAGDSVMFSGDPNTYLVATGITGVPQSLIIAAPGLKVAQAAATFPHLTIVNSLQLNSDWGAVTNPLTFSDNAIFAGGSEVSQYGFNLVRLGMQLDTPLNGVSTTTYIRSLRIGRPRKGRLCVIGDDSYQNFFKLGVPILERYNIPSTAAIIPSGIGTTNVNGNSATLDDLKRFVAAGNICVGHGPNASVGAGSLISTFPSNVSALNDILTVKDYLIANGLTNAAGARCYVWPQGVYGRTNGDVDLINRIRDAGFRVGRCASSPPTAIGNYTLRNLSPGSDAWFTSPIIGHYYQGSTGVPSLVTINDPTENINIANIINKIKGVAAGGQDAFLMLHNVVPPGSVVTTGFGTVQIETHRLASICAAIQAEVLAGRLETVLMSDFVPL